MPAYLTETYVEDYLTSALSDLLFPCDTDLATAIENASVFVQRMHRNNARDGSALLGDTTTDVIVQLATLAALIEDAYARPGRVIELPPNWETSPPRMALDAIISGKHVVAVDQVITKAIRVTPTVTSPPRTSRDQLRGL